MGKLTGLSFVGVADNNDSLPIRKTFVTGMGEGEIRSMANFVMVGRLIPPRRWAHGWNWPKRRLRGHTQRFM